MPLLLSFCRCTRHRSVLPQEQLVFKPWKSQTLDYIFRALRSQFHAFYLSFITFFVRARSFVSSLRQSLPFFFFELFSPSLTMNQFIASQVNLPFPKRKKKTQLFFFYGEICCCCSFWCYLRLNRSRRTHFRNWIIWLYLFFLEWTKYVHLKCSKSGVEAHSKATVTRLPQDDRFSSLFGSQSFATDSIRPRVGHTSAILRSSAMACYPSRERDECDTRASTLSHRRMPTHSH